MNYPVAVIPSYLIVQAKPFNEPALQCKILFTKYSKNKPKRVPKILLKTRLKKGKNDPGGMLGHISDIHTTEKLKELMKLSEKASICNNRVF